MKESKMSSQNDIIDLVADNTTLGSVKDAFPAGCYCCENSQDDETLMELEVDPALSDSNIIICQSCRDKLIDIFEEEIIEDGIEAGIIRDLIQEFQPSNNYMSKIK